MEDEIESVDSLFEGMVLFNPSQLAEAEFTTDGAVPVPQSSSPQRQSSSTTPVIQEQILEPLDENLFSDLTLVTQTLHRLDDDDDDDDDADDDYSISTSSTATTSSVFISRQISRKKKRAAALRIGYARYEHIDIDNHNHNDQNSPSVPIPISPSHVDNININTDNVSSSSFSPMAVDQFLLLQSQISEKLKQARQLASSVSTSRKDAITSRRKAAETLHFASLRLIDLEKQLHDACEAEDFESAETISHTLASAETHKQASIAALRDAEALCDSIDSNMLDALQSQIAAEEHSASLLLHFATDATSTADSILQEAEALSSKEMDDWFSSNEALKAEKMELQIESVLVNDARVQFNNSINLSIEHDVREREFLCRKKDVLTEELQKLLALVKQKENEIAENDSKIKAVEERIAQVVSGFQEMQSSINKKYDNLQSSLSQLDLKNETLLTKKKEIDDFLTKEENRGAKLRELAKKSFDQAKTYQEVAGLRKTLMLSVIKSTEDKATLAKTEEKLSEDVRRLQQEVSAARSSLQELSSTKSSVQQNITSFKQRILFMDKRVPELEAEKKVAAAARNFKEAARLAAEAKLLSGEKDNVQIEMEKANLELGKLEEEIKDTVNRLQETEGLILSKEKEVAMARFQRLLLIAGAAKAERLAALELGDTEEANLLLAEAEAADSEAKKLQPTYNLREEELADLPKHFISMELVAGLGLKQLGALAATVNLSSA